MASYLVTSIFPPDIADFIKTHIIHPQSPFRTFTGHVLHYLQQLVATAAPIFDDLLSRAGFNISGANLSELIAVVVVVMTILAIVNAVRRMIMWWTRFAFRIAWWAVVLAVGAWVWEHGVFESAQDAVVLGGKVLGYAAGVKDVWMSEYQRYEQQQHSMGGGRGRSSGR